MAVEEYADLGKLIKKEAFYIPQFVMRDYTGQGLTQAEEEAMRLNVLKSHQQKLEKMEDDCLKLYGIICQHMSVESKDEGAQEPDYEVGSDATDPEKLWQAVVETHTVDSEELTGSTKEQKTQQA